MKISNYFDIDSIMNRYKSPVLPLKLSTVFTLLVLISCTTHTIDDKPPDNPHGFSSITTKDVLSILLSSNRIEVLDFSPERYSLRTEYFSDSILLKGKSAQNLLDRIEANSIEVVSCSFHPMSCVCMSNRFKKGSTVLRLFNNNVFMGKLIRENRNTYLVQSMLLFWLSYPYREYLIDGNSAPGKAALRIVTRPEFDDYIQSLLSKHGLALNN